MKKIIVSVYSNVVDGVWGKPRRHYWVGRAEGKIDSNRVRQYKENPGRQKRIQALQDALMKRQKNA